MLALPLKIIVNVNSNRYVFLISDGTAIMDIVYVNYGYGNSDDKHWLHEIV